MPPSAPALAPTPRPALTPEEQHAAAQNHFAAGCLCEQNSDWPGAIERYRHSLAHTSPDPRLRYFGHNNLGFALIQLGRHAEAESHCGTAIAINPSQYNAHKNLGLALQGQGRWADAAQSYLRAIRAAPGEPRSARHLETLLAEHPELETAPELRAELARFRTLQADGSIARSH